MHAYNSNCFVVSNSIVGANVGPISTEFRSVWIVDAYVHVQCTRVYVCVYVQKALCLIDTCTMHIKTIINDLPGAADEAISRQMNHDTFISLFHSSHKNWFAREPVPTRTSSGNSSKQHVVSYLIQMRKLNCNLRRARKMSTSMTATDSHSKHRLFFFLSHSILWPAVCVCTVYCVLCTMAGGARTLSECHLWAF